ncbi:MAG TPA: twin transmembrane helix small protein [Steroidobacteraceae bacterium]|nr:twin transmembrane helix small protein [Steroidobacteraceae bacterium]
MIIGTLLAIVVSLGIALYQLGRRRGDPAKMLRALTWRVGLSLALFALLLIAARQGWIAPHDVGR